MPRYAKLMPETIDKHASTEDKTKINRNRDVDKIASTMAEDHVLPIPPGRKLNWAQMEQYLALLTPAMWEHVSIYVYRLWPKIRRQLRDPNSDNYVDCISSPFTLDSFVGHHGGGKYQLQCNDTDARKQLFHCFLEVDDVQHPPILNPEELDLHARENQTYITLLQSQKVLDSKGQVMDKQNNTAAPVNGWTPKDVLDMVSAVQRMTQGEQERLRTRLDPEQQSLTKSVGDILVAKMQQDDPSKLLALLEKFKPDNTTTQLYDRIVQGQNEQNKTVMQMQAEHNKTVFSLIDRIVQNGQQTQQERTPYAEVDRLFGIAERIASWRGGLAGVAVGIQV